MNARALAALLLVATLSGCAACREQPVLCAGAVIVAGAIAAKQLDQPAPTVAAPRDCFGLGAEACR